MVTLEITTLIGCYNRCYYCPQDKLINAYSGDVLMRLDTFETILDNTPRDVQIDFTGFCEPFMNRYASEMMKMSLTRGYRTVLYTTLVGFSINDAQVLAGCKFHDLVFHRFASDTFDPEEYEKSKQLFTRRIHPANREAVIIGEGINTGEISRAGNNWEVESKKGPLHCTLAGKEFKRNVVLPNGDVYLCCQDYSLKHKIGNLLVQNFRDLDRSKVIEMSYQEDSDLLCRKCEWSNYDNSSNN